MISALCPNSEIINHGTWHMPITTMNYNIPNRKTMRRHATKLTTERGHYERVFSTAAYCNRTNNTEKSWSYIRTLYPYPALILCIVQSRLRYVPSQIKWSLDATIKLGRGQANTKAFHSRFLPMDSWKQLQAGMLNIVTSCQE